MSENEYFDIMIGKHEARKSLIYGLLKNLIITLVVSPNYLNDPLKKETGMNTQDHIHYFLIEEAKNILLNSDGSVSEIA